MRSYGVAPSYLEDLLSILKPFCSDTGSSTLKDAEKMVGKSNRVAQVVPAALPFVSSLYAALTAVKRDLESGRNKSTGRRITAKKFCTGARWLRALIQGGDDVPLPLRRTVLATGPPQSVQAGWIIQFDASTTGEQGRASHNTST